MRTRFCILTILALAVIGASSSVPAIGQVDFDSRNYTYIYFENGYPTRLAKYRRPQSDANLAARENPDLVVQTGFYSLKLDCDDMKLTGYDPLPGSDYVAALTRDVAEFTPAELILAFKKDGVRYTCTSGIVQDREDQYVRLIESGRFVQRFDHQGLVFASEEGTVLKKAGRLEIAAWPEHTVFRLDLSGMDAISETIIQLKSPSGKTHRAVSHHETATLAVMPHLDQSYDPLDVSSYIEEASHRQTGKPLATSFNREEYGLEIDLPADRVQYPEDVDRVDEYTLTVRNPSNEAQSLPLIFKERIPRSITGTCMVLCEAESGRPIGMPVQISKNWHRDREQPTVHEGPWLRGYTMVTLQPGKSQELCLKVVRGYWGGVPAVSHAQLCLIGYGGNWKWDESALGCWGESMTYDPTLHLGAAFIDDVRPALTTSMSPGGGSHGWTENVGGGDFLIYHDNENRFRWAKRIKTCYRWTGPNMTEVLYSGVTDDDRIRFNYRVRLVRTGDYHRCFHAYRYTFLKNVDSPERLLFYQMATDFYSTVQFNRYFLGNASGLEETRSRDPEKTGYEEPAIPFHRAWLAIDDTTSNDGETKARRGLISLGATINNEPMSICLHPFNSTWGREHRLLFGIGAESIGRSFAAGDVVRGEIEFILPPKSPEVYWGSDREFAQRLESYQDNPWQAVADEFRHNVQLELEVHRGTLLRNYPIEIAVPGESSHILADFTIQRGGIGHVPIILRNVKPGATLHVQRYESGRWLSLGSDGVAENRCCYQAIYHAKGNWDCIFNIKRPTSNLKHSWRVRVVCQ